jgi:DNA polymerase-3 subunit alpha
LKIAKETQKNKANGQTSLFAGQESKSLNLHLKKFPKAELEEMLTWEKELLGLYVSSHPLEKYAKKLEKKVIQIDNIEEGADKVRVGGVIVKIKKVVTKKGEPMLFVKVEDLSGRIEVIVFPKTLKLNPSLWQENKVLLVSGKVDARTDTHKLICEKAREVR